MKQIEEGDLCKCVYDFWKERQKFGYNYPHVKDILKVNKVVMNPLHERCLYFDELNIPVPLVDECFELLQRESEGDEILNEAFKIANGMP
jgi:hypothetical protein